MANLISRLTKIEQRLKGLSLFEKTRQLLENDKTLGARAYVELEEKIYDLNFIDHKAVRSYEKSITLHEWVKYFWNRFHFDMQDDLSEAQGKYEKLDELKRELFNKRVITQWK